MALSLSTSRFPSSKGALAKQGPDWTSSTEKTVLRASDRGNEAVLAAVRSQALEVALPTDRDPNQRQHRKPIWWLRHDLNRSRVGTTKNAGLCSAPYSRSSAHVTSAAPTLRILSSRTVWPRPASLLISSLFVRERLRAPPDFGRTARTARRGR